MRPRAPFFDSPGQVPSLVFGLGLVLLAGCGGSEPSAGASSGGNRTAGEPLLVVAVNEPLRAFAAHLGGEHVRAELLAPPGVDPAYWTPERSDIERLHTADLILRNGAGYAGWTRGVALPLSRVVETGRAFEDELIPVEGELSHSHGAAGEHSHGGTAFTTWLDPRLARQQAAAVAQALVERLPEHADAIRAADRALAARLDALDARQASAVARDPGRPLLASHPVYPYLARRYGLALRSMHWEPDAAPDQAAWAELEALLATHPARTMLWEDEPLAETAARLRELGVESVVYAPCGNTPAGGERDYLDVAESNAAALEAIFTAD